MVMETFFRAGGLAIVKPLFRPELLPLNGALRATEVEREVGIGRGLVTAAGPEPRDSVIVFSNSGRNPYPVEIAEESRRHGAAVIAFTSVEASRQSDPRATRRLYEVADIILDTNVVAWLLGTGGRRINAPALHTLSDPRNRLWVSSASAYELINKVRLGKWPQAELIALEWNDKLVELDARPLSLEAQDMIAAASLIWEHRDPFDRMISAQAMRRGWAVASADHVFKDLHGIALIEC